MGWNYNYRLGPTGGTLVALTNHTTGVWIPEEGTAGKRGSNVQIPSRHGTRHRPFKFYEEAVVDIRMALRYTSAADTITHADGAPGHVYEHHKAIKALFNTGLTTATLRRAMPDAGGDVDLIGELIQGIRVSGPQFVFSYPMTVMVPTWRAVTESSTAVSPVTVLGDAQIGDAVLEFSGPGTFTHTPTGATCVYSGAGAALVYPNEDRATNLAGTVDKSSEITFNRDYGIILFPGDNAFTGPVTVRWRNQWQIGS